MNDSHSVRARRKLRWSAYGRAAGVLGLALLAACSPDTPDRGSRTVAAAERPTPSHVDSVFPVDEELRRFRAEMDEPDAMTGGAVSLDELVDRYLRAVEDGDMETLGTLVLNRAEFAWFYYPFTMYVERPYELPPGLVWYQLQNRSSIGLERALRQYAGEQLYDSGLDCPSPPEPFGEGRIHHECAVLGRLPTGEEVREVLFGSVLERDGRFKFVGFSNEL